MLHVFLTVWGISALLGFLLLCLATQFLSGKYGQFIGNGFTGLAFGVIGIIPFLPIVVPGLALWYAWDTRTPKTNTKPEVPC